MLRSEAAKISLQSFPEVVELASGALLRLMTAAPASVACSWAFALGDNRRRRVVVSRVEELGEGLEASSDSGRSSRSTDSPSAEGPVC